MMSVPRPAMLVATVTAPSLPAWATISASFSWFLAFSRLWRMPSRASRRESGLVLLDGDGAHQDGLALLVALLHLRDDGPVLALHRSCKRRRGGRSGPRWAVGGDLDDVQVVDGAELLLLGHGGAGHAGELAVEPEVVLEGDGGQGLVLAVDADVLLGLDGLVETGGVAAAEHETAGELIHDDDLAVLHHVVDVPLHDAVGLGWPG